MNTPYQLRLRRGQEQSPFPTVALKTKFTEGIFSTGKDDCLITRIISFISQAVDGLGEAVLLKTENSMKKG